MAMNELGATFIKLGQALSSRPDLLPAEYITELGKLQDEVPPLPFDKIEPVIVRELGCPVLEAYAEFDSDPIASASIGQVYAARMQNGKQVVVKVRRPDVAKLIEQDLEILSNMAEWLSNHLFAEKVGQKQVCVPQLGPVRQFGRAEVSGLDHVLQVGFKILDLEYL